MPRGNSCSPGCIYCSSSCTSAGTGHINDLVDLVPGSWVEYVVLTTLAPDHKEPLTNTATVTPPPGIYDPSPASNSASLTIDYSLIFADGFESGDVSAWSSSVETPGDG